MADPKPKPKSRRFDFSKMNRRNQNQPQQPPPTTIEVEVNRNHQSISGPSDSDPHVTDRATGPGAEMFSTVKWGKEADILPGWRLYFPNEPFSPNSMIVTWMRAAKAHFKEHSKLYNLKQCSETLAMPCSLETMLSDEKLKRDWPNFGKYIVNEPEKALAALGLALHQLVGDQQKNEILEAIHPRLTSKQTSVGISKLDSQDCHKLLTVRGSVMRVPEAKIQNTWVQFDCTVCNGSQLVMQPDGLYTLPRLCLTKTCKTKSAFVPRFRSRFTQMVQKIRLQEMLAAMSDSDFASKKATFSTPPIIDVELKQELVGSVEPGDDITVTAILKARADPTSRSNQVTGCLKIYLEAISVVTNSNKKTRCVEECTPNDLKMFKTVHTEPMGVFRFLVHSLCPEIYGHEMVKAGLLLALFGGASIKEDDDLRTEVHVLVVGDPGMGKSRMLQACVSAAPRGIFVSGCTTTTAGLTVAVKCEKGQGTSTEAGALALADQGVCCIDEFDKMSCKNSALLEVMEQQRISICKAGAKTKISARTTIVAAGNPRDGHYNKGKTVAENLKLSPQLLSRFDLIFILLDRPDSALNHQIAQHLQRRRDKTGVASISRYLVPTTSMTQFPCASQSVPISALPDISMVAEQNLTQRLRQQPGEVIDTLPHELFQKYILHAKKNFHPELSPEAEDAIGQFYMEMRRMQVGPDTLPVTARQLEALCRMSIARARIEMTEVVTAEHVHDVLALVRSSMSDVLATDIGMLKFSRKTNGAGMSGASQIRHFAKLLEEKSRQLDTTLFEEHQMAAWVAEAGFTKSHKEIIDTLNVQGVLLHKGGQMYKMVK